MQFSAGSDDTDDSVGGDRGDVQGPTAESYAEGFDLMCCHQEGSSARWARLTWICWALGPLVGGGCQALPTTPPPASMSAAVPTATALPSTTSAQPVAIDQVAGEVPGSLPGQPSAPTARWATFSGERSSPTFASPPLAPLPAPAAPPRAAHQAPGVLGVVEFLDARRGVALVTLKGGRRVPQGTQVSCHLLAGEEAGWVSFPCAVLQSKPGMLGLQPLSQLGQVKLQSGARIFVEGPVGPSQSAQDNNERPASLATSPSDERRLR